MTLGAVDRHSCEVVSLAGMGAALIVRSGHTATLALAMPIRLRKLIGGIALIVLVTVWTLAAMAVAQFPAVKASPVVETIYYVVAGLGWVLPAMPLLRWMQGGRSRGAGAE
jgi:hypothetical protein